MLIQQSRSAGVKVKRQIQRFRRALKSARLQQSRIRLAMAKPVQRAEPRNRRSKRAGWETFEILKDLRQVDLCLQPVGIPAGSDRTRQYGQVKAEGLPKSAYRTCTFAAANFALGLCFNSDDFPFNLCPCPILYSHFSWHFVYT